MTWKYALAAAAGALLSWLWQRRGELRRRPVGSEELESVVEEFVATAELLLDDFDERRAAMEGLLARADERIAALRGLERGEAGLPAPASPAVPGSPETPAGPSEEAVRAATAMVAAARASQAAARLQGEAEVAEPSSSGRSRTAAKASSASKPSSSGKAASSKSKSRSKTGSKSARSGTVAARTSASTKAPENQPVVTRYQDVLALAQRGMDTAEIARVTSRTTGEVQLILGLQRSLH